MNNFQLTTKLPVNGIDTDVTVDYEIEGDVDGNNAIVNTITLPDGTTIPDDPEFDLKFECEQDYQDKAFKAYMKNGECI